MWRSAERWFLLCLLTLLGAVVVARTEAAPRSLILAADRAWQPFIDAEADDGGLVVKLVTEAFAAADRQVSLEYLPWSRVLRSTAEADFDAIAGAFWSPERDQSFLFSQPIMDFRVVLIGLEGFEPPHYQSVDDLSGLSVGVVQDAAYPEALSAAELDLIVYPSRTGLIRMLDNGRIDLLADTEALFRHHALSIRLNPDDFVVLSPPLRQEPLYLAVPRALEDADTVIADFNRGLDHLRKTGRYLTIRREFGF